MIFKFLAAWWAAAVVLVQVAARPGHVDSATALETRKLQHYNYKTFAWFRKTCVPLKKAISKPGYEVFARGLEAAGFEFEKGKKYTVLVPADGKLEADPTGANGLLGSYAAAGVDPFSVERMRESTLFTLLKDYFPYLVAEGALSLDKLKDGTVFETLFDTEKGRSCVPPGEPVDPAIVDNRIAVLQRDGKTLLEDASTITIYSEVKGKVRTCCGSVVYFVTSLLTPCCASPEGEVCLPPTELPPDDRDTQLDPPPSS